MAEETSRTDFLSLTAEIVSAYVINNSLPQAELGSLLGAVHEALIRIGAGRPGEPAPALAPAVAVKRSVTPDFILCLEDGKEMGLGQQREKIAAKAATTSVTLAAPRKGRRRKTPA